MLTFKIADAVEERAQIEELCYKAFVEEIPQHRPNSERRHVDRFHGENVYAISLDNQKLVGMLAIRGRRPFSLDAKLPDLDSYLPAGRNPCEVRLLAIEKEHRSGPVLPGLLSLLWEHAAKENFDCAVISATTRQLRLYGHLGFTPFGPLVGTDEARFQPMILTRERFLESARRLRSLKPAIREDTINVIPGPVRVHADVERAFAAAPESHRSPGFLDDLGRLRVRLAGLTGAPHAAILVGSGTLANDCVAAQLSGRGVIVSNGEFGERLTDHAARMGRDFEHLRFEWGEPLDLAVVGQALRSRQAWLWVVACETSCGVMNDLAAIESLCRDSGTRLCVDAVSALGAVPLDFSGVHLATGASGKALAAYPGLSIVFHRDPIPPSPSIPRYLDLGLHAGQGTPFTHSSNLIRALAAAVERVDWPSHQAWVTVTGRWLRQALRDAGFSLVGERATPAPHVVTIALGEGAETVAQSLERAGCLVAWASDYLRRRNWIQIAIMGETTRDDLRAVLRELRRYSPAVRSRKNA